ncbi:MAG: adenylate/guanylate cyclase domain-containing protein [Myxococcota bacterium]|nr:adenylate/guanylate cyclase domain-containing protein [Myxococcota bacterium]
MGPAVNLAARLESACEPGKILVGEQTARLVEDSFMLKKVGPFDLKGVGSDVYAWEVIA